LSLDCSSFSSFWKQWTRYATDDLLHSYRIQRPKAARVRLAFESLKEKKIQHAGVTTHHKIKLSEISRKPRLASSKLQEVMLKRKRILKLLDDPDYSGCKAELAHKLEEIESTFRSLGQSYDHDLRPKSSG